MLYIGFASTRKYPTRLDTSKMLFYYWDVRAMVPVFKHPTRSTKAPGPEEVTTEYDAVKVIKRTHSMLNITFSPICS